MTRFQSVKTRGASAIGVPGCPDFACWTASIDSVRMQLIDNWSNCASVSRGELTAEGAIVLMFKSPGLRSCRAVLLPGDQQVSAPDPDAHVTPERMDLCRKAAQALQPSPGRSPARGCAGTG